LQQLGYRSGYVGKWDVNPEHDPTFYGYEEYANSDAMYRQFLQERYPELVYDGSYFGEFDPLPLEDTRTHRTARLAAQMIDKLAESGAPFHLRVNFGEPHLPCRPAAPFHERYRPEDVPEWGSFSETFEGKPYIQEQQLYNWRIEGFTWRDWAPIVARYYAVISQLDDAIGNVLRKLDELGLSDDTLVIYTSDHGDMCGGHRMIDKHYVMYEDVVRVPLAIRWPGVVPAGSRSDRFVYNLLDLPPTILDLTGAPVPEEAEFHGRSLMPLLTGSASTDWRSEITATYNGQQFGLYTQRMIRTEDWKYVWNPTDVDELRNVVRHPAYGDQLRMLRKRLYEILLQDGDGMVKTVWMRDQLLEGRKK
jgi:arylsulfatase A-like enzyme